MIYQVLARKWRPQIFYDIVGQEHILSTLENSLSLKRIHHAYLLSGVRGIGKTTIARLLAKGLNCEKGITPIPCGKCNCCHEIEHGKFIDLLEIDAASRTKVEEMRNLLDNVQYMPVRGRFKIYLIDEIHMLSRHSFNALLKTLEEPPIHVKFLLVTTDPQKLPVTILSRCIQLHLKILNVKQIYNKLTTILQNENIKSNSEALKLLAQAADGSMRDALSLTDHAIAIGNGVIELETVNQMLGVLSTKEPLSLIEAIVNVDSKSLMSHLAQCSAKGIDWDRLLAKMLFLLNQIAINHLSDDLNDIEDTNIKQRLNILTQRISPDNLHFYYKIILIGRKELPYAPNYKIGVEMTLLRALMFYKKKQNII